MTRRQHGVTRLALRKPVRVHSAGGLRPTGEQHLGGYELPPWHRWLRASQPTRPRRAPLVPPDPVEHDDRLGAYAAVLLCLYRLSVARPAHGLPGAPLSSTMDTSTSLATDSTVRTRTELIYIGDGPGPHPQKSPPPGTCAGGVIISPVISQAFRLRVKKLRFSFVFRCNGTEDGRCSRPAIGHLSGHSRVLNAKVPLFTSAVKHSS